MLSRKQGKRNYSSVNRNLICDRDCTTNKKLKLDATKHAEKAQNHHQQVLAEAYSTKRLSIQSESPESTKNGQEEPIVLDAEQPAKPIHVDEQLTVSRRSRGKRKTSQSKKSHGKRKKSPSKRKSQGTLHEFL